MPLPDELKEKYIKQLNPREKCALKIAQEHLGSSFNLEKSIGFLNWIKKNSQSYISRCLIKQEKEKVL